MAAGRNRWSERGTKKVTKAEEKQTPGEAFRSRSSRELTTGSPLRWQNRLTKSESGLAPEQETGSGDTTVSPK